MAAWVQGEAAYAAIKAHSGYLEPCHKRDCEMGKTRIEEKSQYHDIDALVLLCKCPRSVVR